LDHPTVSSSLVEQWGLSDEIAAAVRLHHDIDRLDALKVSARARALVALSVIANFVLARALSQNASLWKISFGQAAATLDVALAVAGQWAEEATPLL